MRFGKAHCALLLAAAAVVAATVLVLPRSQPASRPLSAPDILKGHDPGVVALVERTLGQVSSDAGNPRLWMRLGMVYEANALDSLALDSYQRALAIDASHPKGWYRVARVRTRLGDQAGAIAAAQRAAELEPGYSPVHWRLGLWYLAQGRLERARASCMRAIELNPEDPAGWWALGRVYLQGNQPRKAAMVLEKFLRKSPDDGYARLLLGNAYRRLGRWEEAGAELERGAGVKPLWRDRWDAELAPYTRGLKAEFARAGQLASAGRLDAALQLLRDLQRRHPHSLAVLNRISEVYRKKKDFAGALEILETGLTRFPDNARLHGNVAGLHIELQNPSRALDHLDRALALDPTLVTAYRAKGMVLADMHQDRAAASVFSQGLRFNPDDTFLLLQLGQVQCRLREWGAGIGHLQRAVELDSTFTQAFVEIGRAKKELGVFDEAEVALERAADLNPGSRKIEVLLEEVRRLKSLKG